MNITEVLEERGKRYGEFKEHARITQSIKRAMENSPNWYKLPDYMKEALEMNAHKIGRILNGDPFYVDSWTDVVGYAKLVEDILTKKEKLKNEIISTITIQQSEQTKSLDSSIRPTKKWENAACGNSGQDQRIQQNNLG